MKLTPEYTELLMLEALAEAQRGREAGEVPVGAVIAVSGEIIARAHNRVEHRKDATAHAEVLAIREASVAIDNWRLKDAVLCVTLEPCTMCLGAARLSRVSTIVFGAYDPRMGAVGSLYDLSADDRVGPIPRVIHGVKEKECSELLAGFFAERRAANAASRVMH